MRVKETKENKMSKKKRNRKQAEPLPCLMWTGGAGDLPMTQRGREE